MHCLIWVGIILGTIIGMIYIAQLLVIFFSLLDGSINDFVDTKDECKQWLLPWTIYIVVFCKITKNIKSNWEYLED